MAPPPAGSSLFPYTTLFRSRVVLQLFGFPDSKLKELIDGAACAGGLFSFKQIDEDGCCLFCPLCLELSQLSLFIDLRGVTEGKRRKHQKEKRRGRQRDRSAANKSVEYTERGA